MCAAKYMLDHFTMFTIIARFVGVQLLPTDRHTLLQMLRCVVYLPALNIHLTIQNCNGFQQMCLFRARFYAIKLCNQYSLRAIQLIEISLRFLHQFPRCQRQNKKKNSQNKQSSSRCIGNKSDFEMRTFCAYVIKKCTHCSRLDR